MKKLFFITAIATFLFSCKKEERQNTSPRDFYNDIKLQLKDSLSNIDFEQTDFSRMWLSTFEKGDLAMLRIGFKNKALAEDFILLKLENSSHFATGKIVHISRDRMETAKGSNVFNGHISITSLKRNVLIESKITKGYIDAYHAVVGNNHLKEMIVEIPLMPEVIIVSTYPKQGATPPIHYLNLPGIDQGYNASGTGNPGTSGYYNSSSPGGAMSSGGGGGGGGGASSSSDPPLLIDFEPVDIYPAIDVNKYIKCFSSIPDAGAVCSVRILTDIPVDKDPNVFFDWNNGSPGHTFLQFTKSNGNQIVQQNIGFYPISGWKTFTTPAPVKGKFVDNAGHEFNASLTMNLTPARFQSSLTHVAYLSGSIMYDIDDNNCTDFALNIFNYGRPGRELTIPMYDLPGGQAPNGTSTPQGLYQKLKSMKDKGDVEASNIVIPGVKGFAGTSNGPCN